VPSLAIVTCIDRPEPDPDEELLLAAVADAGFTAMTPAWDDPSVDWRQFDLAVIHSTWNYYRYETAFRQWVETVNEATRLWNPSSLVLRTMDKSYLKKLERQGIPVVPTRFVGESAELQNIVDGCGWNEFVIKPTVSASSFMTKRFRRSEMENAVCFTEELQRTHRAMVQRYLPFVAKGGEISLIHIDRQLTHGVVKHPRFAGDDESVSEAMSPTKDQADLAALVIGTITEPWLYARIDLMEVSEGHWVLSELEVIEPSLFFLQFPPALARFVKALESRIASQ
jgi:hypothetical protein